MQNQNGFELFEGKRKKRNLKNAAQNMDVPMASVCRSGVIRVNGAAIKAFDIPRNGKYLLFYHPGKKIVGLKPAEGEEPNDYHFYDGKNNSFHMSVKGFLAHYKIARVNQTRLKMSLDAETGLILIHNVITQTEADFTAAIQRAEVAQ